MTNDPINSWAARYRGETLVTKYHYIESVIADRLVTHCGRQMPQRNGKGYLLTDAAPSSGKCERCSR